MATAESALLRAVMLRYGRGDCRLFRNNVGRLQDVEGRYVAYGLTKGSADLIGWCSRIITPADVGITVAQFCALEVKTARGRLSHEQEQFIQAVRSAGGIAGVVRSVEDAAQLIGGPSKEGTP